MRESGGTDRTIKAQINKIVLIPSVTFLVLFGVASAGTLTEAISLRLATGDSYSGLHAYYAVNELQKERRLAAEHLGAPSDESMRALRRQIAVTDGAVRDVEEHSEGLGGRGRGDGAAVETAEEFLTALDEREDLRERTIEGNASIKDTITDYGDIIDRGIQAFNTLGRLLDDGRAATANADAVDLMRAQEHLALADAMISGADAEGTMTPGEQGRFGALMADARQRIETGDPAQSDSTARSYADLRDSEHWERLHQLAGEIAAYDLDGGSPEEGELLPGQWRSTADDTNADLAALTEAQAREVINATDAASAEMLTLALGGGLIVLFASTVAYGVASKAAARLTYRLARLRADTLELSREELPHLVRRLERGEQVDPEAELRQLDHGTDEVGQVADAFNTAQRTAVAAAVKQAEVRDGANRVFLGIAHRNQSLVQRQLQVLDRVEREEEDPDLLEDLFQLDHLATRGRRNAENLIILGGQQPGRRWRTPIPLVDILRGAISETEEYARVRLRTVPDLSLPGSVVADVLHLLAELVENATAYSPPHTTVHIHSETVAKGLVVEVEDCGLGMSERELTEANRRLSEAPEFDVMALNQDARLGLFVVARLANKHGIRVELCSSSYGGTRAVVLIPAVLVSRGREPATPRPQAELRTGAESRDLLAEGQNGQPTGQANGAGATRATAEVGNHRSTGGADPHGESGAAETTTGPSGLPKRTPGSSLSPPPASPPSGPEHGADRPHLPKRRRQANLAPQLQGATEQSGTEGPAGDPDRSPDQIRQMFSAFQLGTRRGRDSEDELDRAAPGERPGGARSAATKPSPTGDAGETRESGVPRHDENDFPANGADDRNGPGPLPGEPAYTEGARSGNVGQPAGGRKGESE
ncbi:sensor histidine kinase [Halostreptopolyspora alba]|uniref:histidine kinase n=1 Tax=Halostreptopolyspora alba TaxID=2487137 RepID=A0A3N0E738_9ACTN|nr:sensor histidine kinase [Nocardiopsaceae bacterium YIM 96095]